MRIIACFGIILLHELFASTLYFKGSLTGSDLIFEGVLEHMLMWAVPVFLMVTGALLLDPGREIPMKKLYGKYVRRMALALVIFTLIFQIWEYYMEGNHQNILTGWLSDLIFGSSWAHMWYLYMMLAMYFLLPLFRAVTRSSEEITGYTVILLLIFTAAVPTLKMYGVMGIAVGIPVETVYPLYLFLGYYLYHHKMGAAASAGLTVICSAAIIAVTVMLLKTGQDPAKSAAYQQIAAYSSIFTVGQSAGIFCLLDHLRMDVKPFWAALDKCTFGIYLIHMMGIRYILKVRGVDPYADGLWIFFALAAALFCASFLAVWILRKIPKVDTVL